MADRRVNKPLYKTEPLYKHRSLGGMLPPDVYVLITQFTANLAIFFCSTQFVAHLKSALFAVRISSDRREYCRWR